MTDLFDSPEHLNRTHERWLARSNRDLTLVEVPDEWIWSQCESCRHWIPLAGAFHTDWGVCSNAKSQSDGVVRFAHDGCEQFVQK